MNGPANFIVRHDWTIEEIVALHNQPLLDLIAQANGVHRRFHDVSDVQKAALLSIKTGGCPEDCGYCPQAARYHTDVKATKLMDVKEVMAAAKAATANAG
jgi:biotin synthase